MSNNKQQTAVEWLIDKHFGGIENVTPDFKKHIKQAKEMEVAGKEMSYDDGYAEGYKRALELVEWGIGEIKTKNNESNIRV